MKRLFSVLFIFLILISLCSCQSSSKRIKVESNDFPNLKFLTSGEFSEKLEEEYYDFDREIEALYYVREKDGTLFIYNGIEIPHRHDNLYFPAYKGYFLGTNIGEFGGWLKYYKRLPDHSPQEEVLISEENSLGYQKIDSESFFAFVGDVAHMISRGRTEIYLMEYIDSQWNWKVIAEVDGEYISSNYNELDKKLYIVTRTGIFAVDKSGNVLSYDVAEYFEKLNPNSSVIIENVLYIGTWCGVYAQPLNSDSSIFYPIK